MVAGNRLMTSQCDGRGETDFVFLFRFFLKFLHLEPSCPFLHCTTAVWFRVANERFTGQRLFHQLMEAHSHFSLTTGRPVVLDVAVHFHCFVTAGKTATSRWYTCNFDVVSHLFLTTRPIYHSCPGSHFQQLQQHLTTEAATCVQTVINYYKQFTADQTKQKKRKLKRLGQSIPPTWSE